MSYRTCHTLPPVFLLSSCFFPDPRQTPFSRCSESEHCSDLKSRIYSSNSLCFLTYPFVFPSSPMYCTLSSTVYECLPCEQNKPHQCNRFFSRGRDPFTQACKASGLLTVLGRTSPSVSLSVVMVIGTGRCVAWPHIHEQMTAYIMATTTSTLSQTR